MDDASPLPSTIEKWSENISVWPLPLWVIDVIWSPSRSRDSFGARVCAVVSWGGEMQYQTPARTPTDPINHNDMPHFYSIRLLAKIKLLTKLNIYQRDNNYLKLRKPYFGKMHWKCSYFLYIFWLKSHSFTWRGRCLWPVLQPATRGRSKSPQLHF